MKFYSTNLNHMGENHKDSTARFLVSYPAENEKNSHFLDPMDRSTDKTFFKCTPLCILFSTLFFFKNFYIFFSLGSFFY